MTTITTTDPALMKQMTTQGLIDRFWDNLIKIGKEKITQSYLKARLTLLESYWSKFEECHYALILVDASDVKDYVKKDVYQETEDVYIAVKSKGGIHRRILKVKTGLNSFSRPRLIHSSSLRPTFKFKT